MLGAKQTLLIAALLCFIMFLVLYSAKENRVRGINELLLANVLGLCAYVLYAFGKELPAIFAYEGANTLYGASSMAVLIGYRRLLGRPVSISLAAASVTLLTILIAVFHVGYNSFAWRTVVVSVFQSAVALAIAQTILTTKDEWKSSGYPLGFVLFMCTIIGIGHLYRGARQFLSADAPKSLLEPNGWNLFFFAVGAFTLPVLTLGGLLIAHRAVVAHAQHAANRDFLTGAWSRRAFHDISDREIARAERTQRPLSLLLIDVDNLKTINDTYGHAAGDDALIDFVRKANGSLRAIDSLARIGGDEFAILMAETDLSSAVTAAERLQGLQNADPGSAGKPATCSIGIATYREGDSLESLLIRADEALYKAKAMGRNRVVVEGSPSIVLDDRAKTA
ncbi:MAG TPA: GGDEF domain-containing protein [Noviherbaspirillum sp.]|jgi:diguanylate cyclase (GGDEF)-like protein|uniref:GGDEF domain-containing protein n=1 Tax=Noviherbaspirillum sp. TaxID=1926288 RepID=UPI002DDD6F67|nr:GGDEF domain-containing protein [Noviherbaspirillum sp.]HEV2611371.1 GGDEF domain-containing protein [Noviherbaspirillum sp.]